MNSVQKETKDASSSWERSQNSIKKNRERESKNEIGDTEFEIQRIGREVRENEIGNRERERQRVSHHDRHQQF